MFGKNDIRSYFKRSSNGKVESNPTKVVKVEEEEKMKDKRRQNNSDLYGANLDSTTFQRNLILPDDDDAPPPHHIVIVNEDIARPSKKITIMSYQREMKNDDGVKIITKYSSSHPTLKYKYQCDSDGCEKSFWQSGDLTNHKKVHSDDRPFAFTFDGCGQSFKLKRQLENHLATHKTEKDVECDQCDQKLQSDRLLAAHVQNVHTANDEKNHICSYENDDGVKCGRGFGLLGRLKDHVKIHSQVRSFVCEQCGDSFLVKGDLRIHVSHVHEDTNRVDCEYCGKSYHRRNIKAHIAGHERENNVSCSLCAFEPEEKVDRKIRKEEYRKHCLSIEHTLNWGVSSAATGYKPIPITEDDDLPIIDDDDEETTAKLRVVEYEKGQGSFDKCKNKDCKVCGESHFCNARVVYFRNIKHEIPQRKIKMTCSTPNVIYMLTCLDKDCPNYGKIYIGQTTNPLSKRIGNHFAGYHGPKVAEFFATCNKHLKVIPLLETENIQEVLDIAEVNFIQSFECKNTLKHGLNTFSGGQKGRDQAAAWKAKQKKIL